MVVWHKHITDCVVLTFICVSDLLLAACRFGGSSCHYLLESTKKSSQGGPEVCHSTHSAVELKWFLAACLPKKMEKHMPETCNIGKKAFQDLCCGKRFLIDYLIPCLNLCCLALTVPAIFLFCKYDWSILITCPKCLIKLYYPANHKLANRKLLPQNVTTYGAALNKASNGLFLGCDKTSVSWNQNIFVLCY